MLRYLDAGLRAERRHQAVQRVEPELDVKASLLLGRNVRDAARVRLKYDTNLINKTGVRGSIHTYLRAYSGGLRVGMTGYEVRLRAFLGWIRRRRPSYIS